MHRIVPLWSAVGHIYQGGPTGQNGAEKLLLPSDSVAIMMSQCNK